jgi:hypothetical protein
MKRMILVLAVLSIAAASQVRPGKKVVIGVNLEAGTAPFDYQWQKDGQPIAGATSSTYVINSATIADGGEYTVRVSNSAGSTTSDTASLLVETPVPPVINYFGANGAWASAGQPVNIYWSTNGTTTLTDPQSQTMVVPMTGNLNIVAGSDAINWVLTVSNGESSISRTIYIHGRFSQITPPPTRLELEAQAALAAGAQFDPVTDKFTGTQAQIHQLHTELLARGL